ncbi:conserved protein, unknown function [Hepatocystis sp. ex Piliocolobus tephrosceles]|nr:conserved protein, unknown function [Hepatocystis sp. ex Piliocolobus tephrosceles]
MSFICKVEEDDQDLKKKLHNILIVFGIIAENILLDNDCLEYVNINNIHKTLFYLLKCRYLDILNSLELKTENNIEELSDCNPIEPSKNDKVNQNITTITNKIKTHDDKIKTHDDKIKTHDDRIKTHDDKIKTHDDKIKTHDDKINEATTFKKELELKFNDMFFNNKKKIKRANFISITNLNFIKYALTSCIFMHGKIYNKLSSIRNIFNGIDYNLFILHYHLNKQNSILSLIYNEAMTVKKNHSLKKKGSNSYKKSDKNSDKKSDKNSDKRSDKNSDKKGDKNSDKKSDKNSDNDSDNGSVSNDQDNTKIVFCEKDKLFLMEKFSLCASSFTLSNNIFKYSLLYEIMFITRSPFIINNFILSVFNDTLCIPDVENKYTDVVIVISCILFVNHFFYHINLHSKIKSSFVFVFKKLYLNQVNKIVNIFINLCPYNHLSELKNVIALTKQIANLYSVM